MATWRGQEVIGAAEPWGALRWPGHLGIPLGRTGERPQGLSSWESRHRFPQSSSALTITQSDSRRGRTQCLLQTDRPDQG